VWLHLQSSQKRVKRLLWLCECWEPKTYCSQHNQVAITLSQLAKDVSNVPNFTFILHIHPQATCCSEMFFWKFSERTLFKIFAIISGCFYWASSEYWEVQSIVCWVQKIEEHVVTDLDLYNQQCNSRRTSRYIIEKRNRWDGWRHRCTGVHIFGDAKIFCPNLILFFPNNV